MNCDDRWVFSCDVLFIYNLPQITYVACAQANFCRDEIQLVRFKPVISKATKRSRCYIRAHEAWRAWALLVLPRIHIQHRQVLELSTIRVHAFTSTETLDWRIAHLGRILDFQTKTHFRTNTQSKQCHIQHQGKKRPINYHISMKAIRVKAQHYLQRPFPVDDGKETTSLRHMVLQILAPRLYDCIFAAAAVRECTVKWSRHSKRWKPTPRGWGDNDVEVVFFHNSDILVLMWMKPWTTRMFPPEITVLAMHTHHPPHEWTLHFTCNCTVGVRACKVRQETLWRI